MNYATFGMHLLNATVLLIVKAHDDISGIKVSRFSNAKNLLTGDGVTDIVSPIRVGSLLQFSPMNQFLVMWVYFLAYLFFLVPILCSTFVFFGQLSIGFSTSSELWFERLLLNFSILGIFFSTCYAIYFFVPFTVGKKLKFLRWNFLYPINSDDNGHHPRGDHWLKK